MNPTDNHEEAIKLLQQFGFNESEASCYVGLTRMDEATSTELSEVTDVPRTRIYNAIRVLEAQGLVKVTHSSPKRFRAVPIQKALDRIRNRYHTSFDELEKALNTIEPVESTDDSSTQQIWSVSGREAIDSQSIQLVAEASTEVVLVLADGSLLTESFVEALTDLGGTVDVVIYGPSEVMCDRIRRVVPADTTVLSGERLHGSPVAGAQSTLGRILAIDHSASLISSIDPDTGDEQAVFCQGPTNPVVSLIRQLRADDGLFSALESEH